MSMEDKESPFEEGWRITRLVYIEVQAAAQVITEFRAWLDARRIRFVHSCYPYSPLRHAGYYGAAHHEEIRTWLRDHVGDSWAQRREKDMQHGHQHNVGT
jgi:hypothetical protein